MKYIIPILVPLLTLLISCQPRSVTHLQNKIDSIVNRWLPDKRVGVCNLNLVRKSGGEFVLRGESMFPEAKAEILKLLSGEGIALIDSVAILPDTIRLEKTWGLITLSVANLRSKPAHSAELISQAILGTPVRILKETDEWILIQTPDRYIAWTNKSSVQQMSNPAMADWRKAKRMIYTDICGFIYQDSKQTMVLSDLVAGAIVVKLFENKGYSEVGLPDGRRGFIPNLNWLNFDQWRDTVSLNGDRIISTGKRYLGTPYLWGGASSKALDCSGFVKTVSFVNGVILERDASQQIKHGIVVDMASGWEKLQKGDLLFFGSKQPYRVTHVGMYIGDSEFIHESGYVRINSLDLKRVNFNKDLNAKLLGAKRMVGLSSELGFWPVKQHNWY